MNERVAAAGQTHTTLALAQVVEMLGGYAQRSGVQPAVEPIRHPVPDWLRQRLIYTAKLAPETVDAMSGAQAIERWETFMTTGT